MTDDNQQIDGAAVLDDTAAWFRRFIAVTDHRDIALAALWTVATHLAVETYTSARLLIDSTTPGSGKTTLLDHISRLACNPLHAASLSSPAVLVRALQGGIRTLLVDEVDRSLSPNKPGVEDMIAILNSGYRRGATRPVLVPVKGGGWEVREMPTFSPVALAGNSPRLPDDTRSRAIRILLMPDRAGRIEDSDWELIEADAKELQGQIIEWADQVRDQITGMVVDLPAGCIGRSKEKWRPLKRVAVAAGGHWPATVDELITRGMAETEAEHDAGLSSDPPGMVMLRDLYAVWPDAEDFVPTERLVAKLITHNPDYWGMGSAYGKALTARRLGQLVSQASKITSQRPGGTGPRGYMRKVLLPIWERLGVHLSQEPGGTGETGGSGGNPSSLGLSPSHHNPTGLKPSISTSGGTSHDLKTGPDLHEPPDQPVPPLQPVVSDTPANAVSWDSRRSPGKTVCAECRLIEQTPPLHLVSNDPPRMTCKEWTRSYALQLLDQNVDTISSTEWYAAGKATPEKFKIDNLRRAVMESDLIATVSNSGRGATFRLGAGGTSTFVSCPQWLHQWLRERDRWVLAADAYTAGDAAGHGRSAVKSASQKIGVLKRGASVATEWKYNPEYAKESA